MFTFCIDFFTLACSVFEGGIIPYPKRDFLTEEETEEKADTGASRIGCDKVVEHWCSTN